MTNSRIAMAVAGALGLSALATGGTALAAAPSVAACQAIEATGGDASNKLLFISGASAAQNGFALGLANDFFGGVGNLTRIQTDSTSGINFQVYCGVTTASSAFGASGTNVLVYYRAEGGSVTGLLPIAAHKNGTGSAGGKLKQIHLAGFGSGVPVCAVDSTGANVCTVPAGTITGTSAANGTDDSFGGAVWSKYSDIGVTDVEPAQFNPGTPNYPTPYNASILGSYTASDVSGLTKTVGFQQAFGLYVNTTGLTLSSTNGLSTQAVLQIMAGNFTDWNQVPTSAGTAAASVSTPIKWFNREVGSGSRAATGLFFLNAGCGGKASLPPTTSGPDGFSTGEVLGFVAANAGGISYASIDNSKAGTALIPLNGTAPTNLLAADGNYPWVYESWFIQDTLAAASGGQDGQGTAAAVWNSIVNSPFNFVKVSNAPHSAQVAAIPGKGGNAKTPATTSTISTVGGKTIYIAAGTRGGNSCSVLK